MIKAILIDLDGTLVDSHPALYQVYTNFLSTYGVKGSKEEFKSLIGPSIDEIVEILQKKHNIKGTHHDLSLMYVSLLMHQGLKGTELFPGAKEVLEEAKNRKIKLAIVTSGTKALTKVCLEPLDVYDQFDAIITSEDVDAAKPSPAIYSLALNKLSLKPEEAIAIEDSDDGIKAATGAGLQVLCLKNSNNSATFPNVKYVANWGEIKSWLQSR